LKRKFRLKGLHWDLERRNSARGEKDFEWGGLSTYMMVEEGDEFRVRIRGVKRRRPNSPGTSKRVKFERVNKRKTNKMGLQAYEWSPRVEYRNEETEVRSQYEPPLSAGAWGAGERDTTDKFKWQAPEEAIGYKVRPKRGPGREDETMQRRREEETQEILQRQKEDLIEREMRRAKAKGGQIEKAIKAARTAAPDEEEDEGKRKKAEEERIVRQDEEREGGKTKAEEEDEGKRKKAMREERKKAKAKQ
jgi:hypothetical protein